MADPFERIAERELAEVAGVAVHLRHRRTGAEVLRVENRDPNRVFAIAFRTVPADSTGVAHILEHMVFCGSRRYPLKGPFTALLTSSLQTYLNASTEPDVTICPVASQSSRDFANLVDVYLDAVLAPLLTLGAFGQEAWRLSGPAGGPVGLSGVVLNEMRGHLAAPSAVLEAEWRRSLYPDTVYGLDYGGDPKAIPDLSWEGLRAFHRRFYRPANALVFLWGELDTAAELDRLDRAFAPFGADAVAADVALQPPFSVPRRAEASYRCPIETPRRDGHLALAWMLPPPRSRGDSLAWDLIERLLLGSPAAPLRKALRSVLGGAPADEGHVGSFRQPAFVVGQRGIDPDRAGGR